LVSPDGSQIAFLSSFSKLNFTWKFRSLDGALCYLTLFLPNHFKNG